MLACAGNWSAPPCRRFCLGDTPTVCDQPREPVEQWGRCCAFFQAGRRRRESRRVGRVHQSSLGSRRFEKVFSLMNFFTGRLVVRSIRSQRHERPRTNALATYKAKLEKDRCADAREGRDAGARHFHGTQNRHRARHIEWLSRRGAQRSRRKTAYAD